MASQPLIRDTSECSPAYWMVLRPDEHRARRLYSRKEAVQVKEDCNDPSLRVVAFNRHGKVIREDT